MKKRWIKKLKYWFFNMFGPKICCMAHEGHKLGYWKKYSIWFVNYWICDKYL